MSDDKFKITSAGSEYLPRASEALGRIFATDPAINYMLCSIPPKERAAYLPKFIHSLLNAGALNGAEFQEIGDWACIACWVPPGKTVDGTLTTLRCGLLGGLFKFGISGVKRMTVDFSAQTLATKKRRLGPKLKDKKYHYLWFIGTEKESRGQGMASRLIQNFQKRAEADGIPIWLEASTASSRDVYAKIGFELVDEITMGKGTHAASGDKEEGGPGVTIYPMIWEPKKTKKEDALGA